MLALIEGGELYNPEPAGIRSVLTVGGQVARIGDIDRSQVSSLGLPCELIDARDCLVMPGLVDPHAHITGAGGEQGWASRMPEIPSRDILQAGVTTVVGCLGTDTVTRHLGGLLAKARQLEADGITAYMYTGGFQVPPPTLTGSVLSDVVLIDKVIGLGEIAIADARSSQPALNELARLVADTMVGGTVSGKAGVTHFHVGPGRERLSMLNALLDIYEIQPPSIYPTHIGRSIELMDEAIALARRGSYVDLDSVEDDVGALMAYYIEREGPMGQLTVSSDAHTKNANHRKLFKQFVSAVREHGLPLEKVLPCFTRNAADALKLSRKGRVREGGDADIVVLRKESLEILHVIAGGKLVVRDGKYLSPL